MPEGWFHGRHNEIATIPLDEVPATTLEDASARLRSLFAGQAVEFAEWIRERTAQQNHPFEVAVREADLELLNDGAAG